MDDNGPLKTLLVLCFISGHFDSAFLIFLIEDDSKLPTRHSNAVAKLILFATEDSRSGGLFFFSASSLLKNLFSISVGQDSEDTASLLIK